MPLYKINKNKLKQIQKTNIRINEIKQITEDNLETLFNLQYIRNNFKIKDTTIHTLALNEENNTFTIIKYLDGNINYTEEYKKYYKIILENKKELIEEYKKYTNKPKNIKFKQTKIIFINTTKPKIKETDNEYEIYYVKKYNNDTIQYEKIIPKETNTPLLNTDDGHTEYLESDHLKNKPYRITNFYYQVKDEIQKNFDNIEIIATKGYITYRLNERFNNKNKRQNIIIIEIQRNLLKIWIGMKKGSLTDSGNITIDVSGNNTHKNNDYQVKLYPGDDLKHFINLFEQAYENQIEGDNNE